MSSSTISPSPPTAPSRPDGWRRWTSASSSPLRFRLPGPGNPALKPALVCAALAGLAALQFALPLRTDLPEGSALAPRRARPAPALVSPDYPAILQLPLFTPDRRASDAADGGGLSVVGVIVGHGFSTALISSAGEVRSAHVGGDVGGWRIAAIAPDRVVLEKAGQRAVLPVGGAPAAAPAQPAAAPASQDEQ